MSVIGTGGATYKRRPAFKGIIQQDVSHGKERVRVWPRSRGTNLKEITKQQMEDFRQANQACKYWDPKAIIEVMRWREGTPFLIRDIQISMMYNRYALFERIDGTKVFSLAAQQDVSDSLDAISPIVGSMLVRTPEGWRYVPPPDTVGQVLTADADLDPAWLAPASPGGSAAWTPLEIRDYSVDPPEGSIDVDVSTFNECLIAYRGVGLAASGFRCARVSVDGGATYLAASGDYYETSNDGLTTAATALLGHDTAASGGRWCFIHLMNLRDPNGLCTVEQPQRASTGSWIGSLAGPITNVRAFAATATGLTTFVSGRVGIFAR